MSYIDSNVCVASGWDREHIRYYVWRELERLTIEWIIATSKTERVRMHEEAVKIR